MAADETETTQAGSMAESIAASTRVLHSRLNRLIMARLQLALPPRHADPSLYISGLLHVAPIYITFETLWESALKAPPSLGRSDMPVDRTDPLIPTIENGNNVLSQTERSKLNHELHSALQTLRLPGLMRSDKLKEDLRTLTGWSDQLVEEQLKSISQTGSLAVFLNHMKSSIEDRPHVLVAYAYIFFMALFAGGRFIRASLESIGHAFWDQCPSSIRPNMVPCEKRPRRSNRTLDVRAGRHDEMSMDSSESPESQRFPLGFFHFATPIDGEDLKREFKKRLLASEIVLTTQEKEDIVKESVSIFENMTLLVHQLDEVCSVPGQDIMAGLRDSISVTKERRHVRALAGSEGGLCSVVRSQGKPSLIKSASENTLDMVQNNSMPSLHPQMNSFSGNKLCPGLLKSMRFDQELPKPERGILVNEERAEFSRAVKMARYGRNVASCILFVTFGIIFAGALVTGRKGLTDW